MQLQWQHKPRSWEVFLQYETLLTCPWFWLYQIKMFEILPTFFISPGE